MLIAFDAAMKKEANKNTNSLFTTCLILFCAISQKRYPKKKIMFHAKTSVNVYFHTQCDLVHSHHRLS